MSSRQMIHLIRRPMSHRPERLNQRSRSCRSAGVVYSKEICMTTITISIPDDHLKRLQEIADRLGITLEELLRAGIEQLLSQHETFQNAVDYVLTKNAELYRRLA